MNARDMRLPMNALARPTTNASVQNDDAMIDVMCVYHDDVEIIFWLAHHHLLSQLWLCATFYV